MCMDKLPPWISNPQRTTQKTGIPRMPAVEVNSVAISSSFYHLVYSSMKIRTSSSFLFPQNSREFFNSGNIHWAPIKAGHRVGH